MAYTLWLLMMFVLVFLFPVYGHEACYNDSWTYHSHTYSCFILFRLPKTWIQARDYCHEIQLGSTYGVVTRLAKVDDETTDDFIRTDLFPTSGWMVWIGLYYNTEKNDFRWDGYPNETPKYTATHWERPTLPYVGSRIDGWHGQDSSQTTHLVCQHSAKKIGVIRCEQQVQADRLKFTCTSDKSPVRAKCDQTYKYEGDPFFPAWKPIGNPSHESHTENPGGDISYRTTCSVSFLTFNPGTLMFKMKMYPDISGIDLSNNANAHTASRLIIVIAKPQKPTFSTSPSITINGPNLILVQGSNSFVLICSINTGSPTVYSTTMSCESPITDSSIPTTSVSQSKTVTVGQARGDMDGKRCTCWGNHVTGDTEISTLTFKVITKPTSVSCQSNFHQSGLLVSCHIDKIYPQALAVWSYRQDNEQSLTPLPDTDGCSSEHYADSDGYIYYKSTCSTFLTRDTVTFIPGDLTFQVTVNPNVEGIDKATTSDAFITTQETVTIALPDKPTFIIPNTKLEISSPIHFHENDRIDITCEVQSGNPPVHSVTLSCEFPFKDSDVDYNHTVSGIAYVMDEIASRDMNGKKCTCVGNHLTVPTVSSTLTFNVKYPAGVKDFNVNGQKYLVEVDVNDTLMMSCTADGNPLPSVNIRKLGTSYVDTSTWLSDESGSKVEKDLKATCDHNGRYRCSAHNANNNQEEAKDLNIRVRCPPTFCNETSHNLKLIVRPGTFQTVSLCVVAYPMPVLQLLKYSQTGWNTPEDLDYPITNVISFDSQQNVTINFPVLGPSHLGEYALDYSVGSGANSYSLYFDLTVPLTSCDGKESVVQEVTIGQPVSIIMCVTAFPKPSKLVMQIAHNEFGWRNYYNATITTCDDFDILTTVTVNFPRVKATDLGKLYRLYDPRDANGPYLILSLSERQPTKSDDSSSLSTGAIVGLILASNLVVVILTITFMTAFRKLREGNRQKTLQTSGNGHTNLGFHEPEAEAISSGYVDVPADAILPGRGFQAASRNVSESAYEGDELQDMEATKYDTIGDTEDERRGEDSYEILHADDPNYQNLNRDSSRPYVAIETGNKGTRGVYHVPKPTK